MLSLLDLFCGCGGLSLGGHLAGFRTAVAIDADPLLTSSFSRNFPDTTLVTEDVRQVDAAALAAAKAGTIDGVVGGPPCQGFSEIGRRDHKDLRRLGWRVTVVWQCEVKKPTRLARRLDKFLSSYPLHA
jgi:DNA (cytosine-5)-methyltransferase 1